MDENGVRGICGGYFPHAQCSGLSRKGTHMRTARIVEEGAAYYHIMSRVVDRRMVRESIDVDKRQIFLVFFHGERSV